MTQQQFNTEIDTNYLAEIQDLGIPYLLPTIRTALIRAEDKAKLDERLSAKSYKVAVLLTYTEIFDIEVPSRFESKEEINSILKDTTLSNIFTIKNLETSELNITPILSFRLE